MRENFGFVLLVTFVLVSCVCIRPPATETPASTVTATATLAPAPSLTAVLTPAPTATPIPTPSPTAGPAGPGFGFGGAAGQGQAQAEPLDTAIRLRWAPITGAQGYLIFRDGAAEPLNAEPIPDVTYEDIGLTTGRAYTYTIAALDASGQVIWRSAETAAAAGGR